MFDDNPDHEQNRADFLESLIASYAHEFRTPMYNALLFAELLLKGEAGPLNKKQSDWITIIHDNVNRTIKLHDTVVETTFHPRSNPDAEERDE
jgi:signal transduction histidine kinase